MCHYPIAEWDGFFRGTIHIYGHIHNNKNDAYHIMSQYDNALNAGCMVNGYMPVTLEELIENNSREIWYDEKDDESVVIDRKNRER